MVVQVITPWYQGMPARCPSWALSAASIRWENGNTPLPSVASRSGPVIIQKKCFRVTFVLGGGARLTCLFYFRSFWSSDLWVDKAMWQLAVAWTVEFNRSYTQTPNHNPNTDARTVGAIYDSWGQGQGQLTPKLNRAKGDRDRESFISPVRSVDPKETGCLHPYLVDIWFVCWKWYSTLRT